MTLAILGGTFNPVHFGHLYLAEEVRSQFHFDRIIFVPANIPVHKQIDSLIGAQHRLQMLKVATESYPELLVDDCELKRGGNSYTIDTVREILSRYHGVKNPGLIIGDDLLEDYSTWKEATKLAAMVNLIIAQRISPARKDMDIPCTYIENTLLPVSSSQIRERISRGLSVRSLVPEEVIRYIESNELYSR
ncbi:MAG TPA: nicotinate (nicotinamide) nucleotide adenylyltransferase [bacterium]|nr:nicotinate (nicotinamide) nucleotide adenylyltransferase [bacterium]